MGDKTNIEWTDATWNPVRGCSRISEGCRHCYAEVVAARFSGDEQAYAGLAEYVARPDGSREARWTGEITVGHNMELPLRWKRSRRIFVNSTSDLFHEKLAREDIATVFGVAIAAHYLRGHTLQILTKRADKMQAVLTDPAFWEQVNIEANMNVMEEVDPLDRRRDDARATMPDDFGPNNPPPGIWLGVSVEDQQRANERIPLLLETPAAKRFLSCEPLLGPVDLTNLCSPDANTHGWSAIWKGNAIGRAWIDWVIVGGESGPNARPMHPDWARSLRDQCQAEGVPYFFKQWGEWVPTSGIDVYCHGPGKNLRQYPKAEGIAWLADGRIGLRDFPVAEHRERIRAGVARSSRAVEVDHVALADFQRSIESPQRVSDNPLGLAWMYRVGKKAAGRLLDGREWNEVPK
jgi:protein gp37